MTPTLTRSNLLRHLAWPATTLVLVLLTHAAATRPPAEAADPDGIETWHRDVQVASTGEIDDADVGEILYSGARALFKTTVTNGSAVLRFSLQPGYEGDTVNLNVSRLGIRFKDNGSSSRIVAVMKAMNINTGVTTTLHTIDSDLYPQVDAYQHVTQTDVTPVDYNSLFAYFVEVTMTKTASSGKPELLTVEGWWSE